MTELSKIVRRKVATLDGRPLVVALTPEGITLRAPRGRDAYLLPYGTAMQWAAELKVNGGRIAKPRRVR
jgi:hypothetical protein